MGQLKECFIYRFAVAGTMEEKIHNRQINKLSVSARVLDEKSITPIFKSDELSKLYEFAPPEGEAPEGQPLRDSLLSEILENNKHIFYNTIPHDSLLNNNVSSNDPNKSNRIVKCSIWLYF